jgi:DNA-binding NtrC family response regulator
MTNQVPPVLIIEDEPEIVEFISEALKRKEIKFQATDNFPEAMNRLSNQVYTAIIVDIKIKKGSGDKIINTLRDEMAHRNHRTPIVLTSGHLDRSILDGMASKIQGAFVKPYSYDKLADWVFTVVEARRKTMPPKA